MFSDMGSATVPVAAFGVSPDASSPPKPDWGRLGSGTAVLPDMLGIDYVFAYEI